MAGVLCLSATTQLRAQDAVHAAHPYVPGQPLEMTASFNHDDESDLLSLAWFLTLPVGWTVQNVSGDGEPELAANGTEILFQAQELTNSLNFTITLNVPETASGAQSLSAVAEYWFSNMDNPADLDVTPDPLVLLQDPKVTAWPQASPIVYGQSLTQSSLTDGAAEADGSFAFADPNATPGVGTHPVMVVFSPTEPADFASVSKLVNVTVTEKPLSLVGIVAQDKHYDGTNTATIVDYGTVEGRVGDDDVNVGGIIGVTKAFFDDALVGAIKTVTVGPFVLFGDDASNYSIGNQTTTAAILARVLTVAGSFTVDDKLHDGNTAAAFATDNLTLENVVEGEEALVGLSPVATFASAEIGNWTVSLTEDTELTGTGKGNYTLSLLGAPTTTAYILPFPGEDSQGVPGQWYIDFDIEPKEGDDWTAVAFYDSDDDGLINWQEYVAGTDPTDDTSRLIIAGIKFNPGPPPTVEVEWIGGTHGPTAPYVIESTACLVNPVWRDENNEASREDGINEWSGTAETLRFYRVRATGDE